MTRDELKANVCKLFEFGEDKWFDYEYEFVALATLIRNQTLDEIASKMAGFTWFDGDDAAEEIRSMKT